MNNDYKIRLGELKNVNSVNVDNNINLQLDRNQRILTEYDISNILDVSQQFNDERDRILDYRFYGKINYFSLLNGLKEDYSSIFDLFKPQLNNNKNIYNSFEVYLLIPHTGYTDQNNGRFVKNYVVAADLGTFLLNDAGFDVNIFGEQTTTYNIINNIDLNDITDGFGLPITETYLYFQYLPGENSSGDNELTYRIEYNNGVSGLTQFTPTTYSIGEIINFGDLVQFNTTTFSEQLIQKQKFRIRLRIRSGINVSDYFFEYSPFIPIKLRYFSDVISRGNTGNTAYDVVNTIPSYAKPIDNNGNYIWRNIQNDGYIDPITGEGNDFPFVNGKKYVYSTINLIVRPDFSDSRTELLFNEIEFDDPTSITNKPTSDLNNIGKLCQ